MDPSTRLPIITLIGPPGIGKSATGAAACTKLGLRFLDFSTDAPPWEAADPAAEIRRAKEALAGDEADVIALSWSLMDSKAVLKAARQRGEVLLLWEHPLVFQPRSRVPIKMTPGSRTTTRGGFGRRGGGCREYRRLQRASTLEVDLSEAKLRASIQAVTEVIEDLRKSPRARRPSGLASRGGRTIWSCRSARSGPRRGLWWMPWGATSCTSSATVHLGES